MCGQKPFRTKALPEKSAPGHKPYVRRLTIFKIPKIWKMANVVALHKKDSKLDPLNYRPVSLTCILCKTYEKFIRRHILNFVEGRINVDQHGRLLRTSVRGNYSSLKEVISGVPQGSVLEQLLFCLFINDLPDHVKNVTKLFADDLKLVANASEKSEICEDSNVLN